MSVPDFECPFCGGREGRVVVPASRTPSRLSVVRCAGCDLIFAHPRPSSLHLESRYTADYFRTPTPNDGGYEDYRGDEPLIRKTFLRRLPLFQSPSSASSEKKALLDVGCATGIFLDLMARRGWDVHGVDVSEYAAAAARGRGVSILGRRLDDVEGSRPRFDVITLWDVIEHLENPLAALARCYALLRPGGRLVLTTPDASSGLARLLGRRWLGFRPVGEHVFFFGKKTIRAHVEKVGFRVLRVAPVGKYFNPERLLTRLCYYTRLFRLFERLARRLPQGAAFYVNSRDTLCLVAEKP